MSTNLDFSQVIQKVYDESENRLRVDAELTASIIPTPGLEVAIDAADDNIAIRNSNNTNELLINPDGSINTNATVTVPPSVNQGNPNTLANGWPVKLTNGINLASVNADGSINVANVTNVISSSATLSNVTSSVSSQTVLSANPNRKGFILYNDSTANCFIAFAATTTTSSFSITLNSKMTYQNEAIIYQGVISAIWDSANGFLRVTELT